MIGAGGELPAMRVGFVTIHAPLKGERFLEIPASVTLSAVDACVLSLQRKLSLGVVEALMDRVQRNFLPSQCAVARLATLRKTSVMRIFVAIGTLAKSDSGISRLIVRAGRVAFRTSHLTVLTRQRILRPRVIELHDVERLPILEVVTLLASLPEASAVRILMASRASGREAQISLGEIFNFDGSALSPNNIRRLMALIAGQPCMFAQQRVSRLFVIECFDVPLDQGEIFSVML
jgi:hypothetical protein